MKRTIYVATSLLIGVSLFACNTKGAKSNTGVKEINSESKKTTSKPNIIYILADDLGYGDLSSYGQQKFETPYIDQLVTNGMKFTQHYCGSAVCAPSRSSLITGEHTGHTPIRGNKELVDQEGQVALPGESITIAEVLKEAGYVTGAFGKWGLGFIGSEGDPTKQGFDEFYGYNCQRMAHRYYPTHLWNNEKKVPLDGNDWTEKVTYAPNLIQDRTLQFLEENKDKPFFAFVPLVLPHAELISPNDDIYKKFEGKFKEVPHSSKEPYTSDYGPDIKTHMYCSQEKPFATFASMVYRLDSYVGQIVKKVEELGISENTIIMFASDNGPHTEGGANPEFFNSGGGLRGVKRDLYEGGIRTPFIVKWEGKIKAGSSTNHISAFWDILPTLADISGGKAPNNIDGISFLPTLLQNRSDQKQHDYLYWEFPAQGGRKAVRKGKWKAVRYNILKPKQKQGKYELYDLSVDPSESKDIAAQYPDVVKEMKKIMETSHKESVLFPW